MSIEVLPSGEVSSKEQQRLPLGHKLLLAGPAFLMAFCFKDQEAKPKAEQRNLEEAMSVMMREYYSIHNLFTGLLGKENIIVVANSLIVGKTGARGVNWREVNLPKELDFGSEPAAWLREFYCSWPRDAHTIVGDRILANEKAWSAKLEALEFSGLGEGGKVLIRNNGILVTPDIWKQSKLEIDDLRQRGFNVGYLPSVNPSKQKYDLKKDHIDGHASLIEDKNGELVLLVADSYSHQGSKARDTIRRGAEAINARMVEVADANLPPLAFNLLQFEDGSVALTDSEAQDLTLTLSGLVGPNKVFTTDIPIQNIPSSTCGGIRCLTNTIPSSLAPRSPNRTPTKIIFT